MEQLLSKLGIDANQDSESILAELERKQMEYLDRLDNVEEEERREQLKAALQEIESAISMLSWHAKRTTAGMKRDAEDTEEESEDFSDLKNKEIQKQDEALQAEVTQKVPEKTEEERYDEALAVMATPDYAKGVEMMRRLAEQGNAKAQNCLGCRYRGGQGVERNDQLAVEWFRKAANQGNADAQQNLGLMYLLGMGVEQNDGLAVELYQKSADQGNAAGQYGLGCMYRRGRGVERNYYMATKWYQKAAGQGNAYAQRDLDIVKGMEEKLNDICNELLYRIELKRESTDHFGLIGRISASKCETACKNFMQNGLASIDERKEIDNYINKILLDQTSSEDMKGYNGLVGTINKRYRDYLKKFKSIADSLSENVISDFEVKVRRTNEGISDLYGHIETLEMMEK